ncbi:hypothetical protein OHA02_51525 [Streptomyces phaeochromogenes]|nr:hypothetical protein [Streptomyces phaeochromogenes]
MEGLPQQRQGFEAGALAVEVRRAGQAAGVGERAEVESGCGKECHRLAGQFEEALLLCRDLCAVPKVLQCLLEFPAVSEGLDGGRSQGLCVK